MLSRIADVPGFTSSVMFIKPRSVGSHGDQQRSVASLGTMTGKKASLRSDTRALKHRFAWEEPTQAFPHYLTLAAPISHTYSAAMTVPSTIGLSPTYTTVLRSPNGNAHCGTDTSSLQYLAPPLVKLTSAHSASPSRPGY